MPTHSGNEPEDHKPEEVDTSAGYERKDIRISGVVVFITAMFVFVVVVAVVCFGVGKVLNARMNKEDGPNSKWTKTVDVRQLGNLPSSPQLQNKMAELTQDFPTPRLQTDDGNQDIADLHAREDILLGNYSWVDRSKGKVRIPIERAMELLAQRGLPVATAVDKAPLMVGDSNPTVTEPLTNGFARTGYEQEETQRADSGRAEARK